MVKGKIMGFLSHSADNRDLNYQIFSVSIAVGCSIIQADEGMKNLLTLPLIERSV
jgi:hypothetical protein